MAQPGLKQLPVAPRSPLGRPARAAISAAALAVSVATLAGCGSPRGVPSGSRLVTEATVKSSFQAPADGMLWIFRVPTRGARGQLHYSGPIAAGEVLVIDPSMNKATVDGQALDLVLPSGDVLYQAYFRPDKSVRPILADRPRHRTGVLDPSDGAAPAEDRRDGSQ
jgi:hypothetical protein